MYFRSIVVNHERTWIVVSFACLVVVFADRGVSLDKPIVTMCNSGMSSCSLLLAARLAGSKQSSVFQVSGHVILQWDVWSRDSMWVSWSREITVDRCLVRWVVM